MALEIGRVVGVSGFKAGFAGSMLPYNTFHNACIGRKIVWTCGGIPNYCFVLSVVFSPKKRVFGQCLLGQVLEVSSLDQVIKKIY